MLNQTVLMSGADYFSDQFAINAHMNDQVPVDVSKAKTEHQAIHDALEQAGIKVITVPPPAGCQDGVYTANWALCRGNKALLSSLPKERQAETPYAEKVLRDLGKEVVKLPEGVRFSGQGDALPCGNYLFCGTNYRTDKTTHDQIANLLNYEVIGLETVPKRSLWGWGPKVINKVTGWPDSYYYDIDLALAIIKPDLIAYCPKAFTAESRHKVESLPLKKIKVDLKEAKQGFACNLVSTGEIVIMSAQAPKFKAALETEGLKVLTPDVTELGKGGGYIRCTSLTLDNL